MSTERHRVRPSLEAVTVTANERVAEGVGSLVLDAPICAGAVEPGQFVHLRVAQGTDPILRRPFSVHRVSGQRRAEGNREQEREGEDGEAQEHGGQ